MNITVTKYFSASLFALVMTIVWAVVAAMLNIPFYIFLLVLFVMDAALAYFVVRVMTAIFPPPNHQ